VLFLGLPPTRLACVFYSECMPFVLYYSYLCLHRRYSCSSCQKTHRSNSYPCIDGCCGCYFCQRRRNATSSCCRRPLPTSTMATENQKYCITFDNVKEAAARIHGVAHRTPVLTSQTVITNTGKNYFFKVEAMQKTGSFKFRGALNAVKTELEADPTRSSMPVVTHSSGVSTQRGDGRNL
jgi:hypothetical protein